MIIFLIKIYGKSCAILEVDFPFNRITLRAEKALRVILAGEEYVKRLSVIEWIAGGICIIKLII